MKKSKLSNTIAVTSSCLSLFATPIFAIEQHNEFYSVEIIADRFFGDTSLVSPNSTVTKSDIDILNVINAEDIFANSPGVAIRKRFIGDENGVLGIRGSNMFQTSRTMVFVDGMPLHNHLRTRWNGAPRWSLVSADDIEHAEVVYGPFSAEYSGNAMGGVINIQSRRPQKRRFTAETSYFSQEFNYLAADDNFDGHKAYLGFEDKVGDLSFLLSYTRLENDSQPQTFFFDETDPSPSTASTTTASSGFIAAKNEFDKDGYFFGDTGVESVTTNLFNAKVFFDLDSIQLRTNISYEARKREAGLTNSYLRDVGGDVIYDRRVDVNGEQLSTFSPIFFRSVFQGREREQNTLLVGLGASWQINDEWYSDLFYSYFEIIKDREIRTAEHPDASNFVSRNNSFAGRLTDFENGGWQTLDIKLGTNSFLGDKKQRISLGLHLDHYDFDLTVNNYDSINDVSQTPDTQNRDSRGKAATQAIFAQYGIESTESLDLSFGLRYETWEAKDGVFQDSSTPTRKDDKLSPKLSVAYNTSDDTQLRYSLAKAVRFPIMEELYINNSEAITGGIPNPNLFPEEGVFHSFSINSRFGSTEIRFNLFYEEVEDVIFTQTIPDDPDESTFLNIDEVTTKGAEIEINAKQVFDTALNMRFSTTYTDAEITRNINNPTFVGKEFPRIPAVRANLILSYDVSDTIRFGTSLRYASETSDELDNSDTNDGGFGSFTDYTFVGIKANWQTTEQITLSAGIDNLFNELAFVHHPYPGRTFFLNAKYMVE